MVYINYARYINFNMLLTKKNIFVFYVDIEIENCWLCCCHDTKITL